MKKSNKAPNTLARFSSWVFAPPYYGVPWLVWLYAFASMFLYLHASGPLTGHLIGFDDHVRMVQVLDLLNGANWYDRTIERVNAPEGFHTIWPRIVDLPIAFVILIAQQFTDQKTAALIASVVLPYAELALLFAAATYFARPLVGKNHARLMALFLVFTSILNQKRYTIAGFHPGQASHHSWYIILNVVMFGAAARVMLNARGKAPALMLGGAIALLLAVGIEGYPMVAGLTAVFAVMAWAFDFPALAQRGAFGIGLGALFSLLLLPLNRPPSLFFEVSFAEPSILTPILVATAALFLKFEEYILRAAKNRKVVSGLALTIMALAFAAGLIAAFPQVKDGAAAALSPAERTMAFQQHPESWGLHRVASSVIEYIGLVMPIILALGAGIYAVRIAPTRRRKILYSSFLGFALVGGAMAQIFWRYYHHAMTTACVWLLWAWRRINERIKKNIYLGLKSLGVFVMLCPFWMLYLPALQNDALFTTQIAFFPSKVLGPWDPCDIKPTAAFLNAHYGKDTNIIVPGDDSAKFLYHTDLHIDFLANFPSQDKFIENTFFFQTQDPNEAKQIARRHKIDLVALCPFLPLTPADRASRPQRKPMFMEMLVEQNPPTWVRQLNKPAPGDYLLFEVNKKALQ